jgi:hypothetical protein
MKFYELSDDHGSIINLDIIQNIQMVDGLSSGLIWVCIGYEKAFVYDVDRDLREKDYSYIKEYLLNKNEPTPITEDRIIAWKPDETKSKC